MRRLLLAAVVLLSACSGGEDLTAADAQIKTFHSELNSGDFQRIYADSAQGWKNVSSSADTIQLFTGVHNKLGAFLTGNKVGWRVNYTTGGTFVIVQYASKFQKGEAQETFTFQHSGNATQLVGYNVNSRALITG